MAGLRRRSRSTIIGMRDRERANIILLRIEGLGVEAVAERLNTTSRRVSLWSTRFAGSGLDGLADEPGRGGKAIDWPSERCARHHRGDTSPAWQKPLEYSLDGMARWHFGEFSAAHLVRQ